MYKKIFLFLLVIIFSIELSWSQEDRKDLQNVPLYSTYGLNEELNQENISMFKVLLKDFLEDTEHRQEKIDCYKRYSKLFFNTLYGQLTGPIVYVNYYLYRKKITNKLEDFYKENDLGNVEDIGKDILKGTINEQMLKKCLGNTYYKLWLYGDTEKPIETGGVPQDYKQNLPMFARRWFYSGVRNARWNATYIENYTSDIVKIITSYDNRQETFTHNYGTGDTRLGMWLRWYVDKEGKWWFFYENTKRTKENKGKLFYFGVVGLGEKKDGEYPEGVKRGRFEFSLNREVTID